MAEQCPYYNVYKAAMPGHFMCEKQEGDCLVRKIHDTVRKIHDTITKPGSRGE